MGILVQSCMFCRNIVGEKSDGKEGNERDETASLCDPCLDKHYPQEAPRVRAYRQCAGCKDKTWKCKIVACDELSKRLDEIDIALKAKGV